MSAQATETRSAIELIVEQDEDGSVTANVPVRWRISEEMAQTLAEKAVEPYMLLVIAYDTYEVDRYLVPLKAGMMFLQMRRPGTNTIYATIVWQREGEDSVKKVVLAKNDYGNYELQSVDFFVPGLSQVIRRIDELDDAIRWGELDEKACSEAQLKRKLLKAKRERMQTKDVVFGLKDSFRAIERTTESDQVHVEVPQEMFAAEPPRWMTWLGTRYKWPRKAQDQCDLRRRALATAVSLPFVVPFILVFAAAAAVVWLAAKFTAVLATGVLLFFGKRNLDYSVIYEWDNVDIKSIWCNVKPSIWTYRKIESERPHRYVENHMVSETKYVRRDPVFTFLNPPFVLGSFLVGCSLNALLEWGTPLLQGLAFAIAGAIVIGCFASLISQWWNRRETTIRSKQVITDEQRSRMERELALLTAGGSAKLSDLPAGQRTVKLRYLNLKAAVCKPFAR